MNGKLIFHQFLCNLVPENCTVNVTQNSMFTSEIREGNYVHAVEIYPEYDKDDIAAVMDIVYEAVKEIITANILILQGRDNFISSLNSKTITKLIKAKLYGKLSLKDWYGSLLSETYANMKMF